LGNLFFSQNIFAACGGTVRTWDAGAGNVNWNNATNWNINDLPDTVTEDGVIVGAARATSINASMSMGCLTVNSGSLNSAAGTFTVGITGDYFRNLTGGLLAVNTNTATHALTFDMAGTAAQTFENVDIINFLRISNNTTVTLTNAFAIRRDFTITGTGTTVYINDDLNVNSTAGAAFIIPASVTVELAAGKTLTANRGLTINGTLIVNPGATVLMGSGRTLSVATGGVLRLDGNSGNVARIASVSGTYNFNVIGSLYADYFRADRISATGINLTGTFTKFDNGEIQNIPTNGWGITLGAAAVVPAAMNSVAFYGASGATEPRAIRATAYNLSVMTFNNWAGIGNIETRSTVPLVLDPNNKITWGTQAGIEMTIGSNNNINRPGATTAANAVAKEFAIFTFALNQSAAATDVTSLTFTLQGTGDSSDIDFIQVFRQGASCQTLGTQIGGNLTMTGSPAKATVTIPATNLTVSGTSPECLHVWLKTNASATTNATIGLGIDNTIDVTNSLGYNYSATSAPPITAPLTTVTGGGNNAIWSGATSTVWRLNGNWQNNNWPGTLENCKVGSGTNIPLLTASEICQNADFLTGGVINFNNGFLTFTVQAGLTIQSGFSFTNAANSTIIMGGTSTQSITSNGVAIPRHLTINNTGGATEIISVNSDLTVTGNLTVTSGTLQITAGKTLTVLGNITVATGAVLDIEPNATLKLANGSVLTVNAGGTLEIIGTGATNSMMDSNGGANGYTVVINGTIKAKYYSFSHLTGNGLTINNGATIDATNNLTNGTFKYPVANSTFLLRLYRKIPSDTLSNMNFDLDGSAATSVTNIYTDAVAGAGTLVINPYSGNLSGATYDTPNTYLITWGTLSTTLNVTAAANAAASLNPGTTMNMGRFAFVQASAGSFSNTDITSLSLTLQGTGSAGDISAARIYYDNNCDSAGGTQIGSAMSFTGSPATAVFSGLTGATVESNVTTPPTRCIYVEFDIASNATNAATLGVSLASNSHLVDSQSYGISAATSAPISLNTGTVVGSSTTWTGSVSTDWYTAGNWSAGLPTNSLNCTIPNVANDPIIGSGTAACKNVDITNGILVLSGGATLEVYGSFASTGTFTQTGSLVIRDTGAINQTINISSLNNLTLNKSNIGNVDLLATTTTIAALTVGGSAGSMMRVANGKTLVLTNGATISGSRLQVLAGGTVKVASGATITLSGGTFDLTGTAQAANNPPVFPYQTLTNKAAIQNNGAGTWSFNSTSGSIRLNGFLIKDLDTNGFVIGGTTSVSQINGGQFQNLSNAYASVKVMQFNSTGTLPASATNVGWSWQTSGTIPTSAQGYKILSSTGCGSQSMDFSGWFGDWYDTVATFDPSGKISQTGCNLTFGAASTAVSLIAFTATAYNGAVDLRWETGSELDHFGFNVYRKKSGTDDLVQINSAMVRNYNGASVGHGLYRYVDFDADNGSEYEYYIEDYASNGTKKMHGPKIVTPLGTLGAPPADNASENNGSNPNDGASGTPNNNPTYRDLGHGVEILSQSASTMRLKISPGILTFSNVAGQGTYEQLAIPGYARSPLTAMPETLERTILIEVDNTVTTASILVATVNGQSVNNTKDVVPAPTWAWNGTVLAPTYTQDAATYAVNSNYPSLYYDNSLSVSTIDGRKFLRLKIYPTKYNPVVRTVTKLNEMIMDVDLNGGGWTISPPASTTIHPGVVANTLRIKYQQTGVYKILFSDLVVRDLEGPFSGVSNSDLRLYHNSGEIPLKLTDANTNGVFDAGDSLRFYLDYQETLESNVNYAILSTVEIGTSGQAAKRIDTSVINGDKIQTNCLDDSNNPIICSDSADTLVWQDLNFESNLQDRVGDSVIGEGLDHFFWQRIWVSQADSSNATFSKLNASLPNLESNTTSNVTVVLELKGGLANDQSPYQQHVGIYINNSTDMLASKSFADATYQKLTFIVPARYFRAGNNNIYFKLLATDLPATCGGANCEIAVDINKFSVRYPSTRTVNSNVLNFYNRYTNSLITVDGFNTTPIYIWDVSDLGTVTQVANLDTSIANQVTFLTNPGSDETYGRHYYAFTTSNELSPTSFELTPGVESSLKATSSRADFIIIGHDDLLAEVYQLVEKRNAEGLETKLVSLDQIYAEFSNNQMSSYAIREFISYAKTYWDKKPTYVLILGDGTYDPALKLGNTEILRSTPIPVVTGNINDFGSDNWFVTPTEFGVVPNLTIGRIPTSNKTTLKKYIQKVLDYEDGPRSPTASNSKVAAFFAGGKKNDYEDFYNQSLSVSSKFTAISSSHSSRIIDRAGKTDPQFKTQIINEFNTPPVIINYFGHGAENEWGDNTNYFETTDVQALSNSRLPMLAAFNCWNGKFFNPDSAETSLGESAILNPNGGAIAFFGATDQTSPSAQKIFAQAFYAELSRALNTNNENYRVGTLMYAGKVALGDSAHTRDVLNSYVLLGDPTLKIPKSAFNPSAFALVDGGAAVGGNKVGGGCSAIASDGEFKRNWIDGIFEILFLLALYWSSRMLFRFKK